MIVQQAEVAAQNVLGVYQNWPGQDRIETSPMVADEISETWFRSVATTATDTEVVYTVGANKLFFCTGISIGGRYISTAVAPVVYSIFTFTPDGGAAQTLSTFRRYELANRDDSFQFFHPGGYFTAGTVFTVFTQMLTAGPTFSSIGGIHGFEIPVVT